MIVILLVFVSITAYSLNAESHDNSKTEITVDEGYDEITVEVPHDSMIVFPDNEFYSTAAKTLVNGGEGFLEIETSPRHWGKGSERYLCEIPIEIQSNFPSELDPQELIIEAKVVEAPGLERDTLNWDSSHWKSDGLDL